MPLSKRFLADAHLYSPPDLYEDSSQENLLRDISSAGNLGVLHQISFLSLYAFEMFDNLSRLAEDVGVRIINATERTSHLVDKITDLEKRIERSNQLPLSEEQQIKRKKQTAKFLKARGTQHIPSALNKQTNCVQVNGLYGSCNLPPQFWKLEAVIFDDCLIRYSNPGYFFEEWLKVELIKQEENRLERKRLKKERKLAKKKRKEDEALADIQGNLNPHEVRRKELKEQRKKKKANKKEKSNEDLSVEITDYAKQNAAIISKTTSALFSGTTSTLFSSPPSGQFPQPLRDSSTGKSSNVMLSTQTPSRNFPPTKTPTKPPPTKPPPSKPPPSKAPRPKPQKKSPPSKPPTKPPQLKHPQTEFHKKSPPSRTSNNNVPSKLTSKNPPPNTPSSSSEVAQPPLSQTKKTDQETLKAKTVQLNFADKKPLPEVDGNDEDEPPPSDEDPTDDLPPSDDDTVELPEDIERRESITDVEKDDLPSSEIIIDDDDAPPEDEEGAPSDEDMDDLPDDEDPEEDIPPDEEEFVQDNMDDNLEEVDPEVKEDKTSKMSDEDINGDSNEEGDEEEDAFEISAPLIQPVMQQATPKRKQSILMIGRDKKRIAEVASANLQKLTLAGGAEDFDNTISALDHVEQNENYTPPVSGAARRRASLSDSHRSETDTDLNSTSSNPPIESGRRKSILSTRLNLGLDLEVQTGDVDAHHDFVENKQDVEWGEGGLGSNEDNENDNEQYYNYDENEYDYDENGDYYQDGYFWNGTEWVVAEEAQHVSDGEAVEENVVEDDIPSTRQSSLAMFGGNDILASIRQGQALRKTEPIEPKKLSARDGMLSLIKQGGLTLKKADLSKPLGKKPNEKPDQSDAIARLLSNRAQIAGTDSDSDSESDSDSDDSYF